MTQYILDLRDGIIRPVWTDMDAIGFLISYLDAMDAETPAEAQMAAGYVRSAGFDPYTFDPAHFYVSPSPENDGASLLHSSRYPEDAPYTEVSRTTAGDGSTVIMFEADMTVVIRGGEIVWIARLD